MKKFALLGVFAALLAAGAPAQAGGLTLTGETGVARTPLAATLAPMEVAVAADFVTSADLFVPARIEMGVLPGLEIGLNYWYMDTADNAYQWGLNAKYLIPAEVIEDLKIAAGFSYQSYNADGGYDYSTTRVYGVATFTLDSKVPITPSLGFSYEVQGGDKDRSGVRFFGSLLGQVRPKLALGVEFATDNDDLDGDAGEPFFWLGARYALNERLTFQGGIINNANAGGDDISDYVLHAGAQYAFSIAR